MSALRQDFINQIARVIVRANECGYAKGQSGRHNDYRESDARIEAESLYEQIERYIARETREDTVERLREPDRLAEMERGCSCMTCAPCQFCVEQGEEEDQGVGRG